MATPLLQRIPLIESERPISDLEDSACEDSRPMEKRYHSWGDPTPVQRDAQRQFQSAAGTMMSESFDWRFRDR